MSNYELAFSAFPPGQGISCNNYPNGNCQTTMNWCISLLPYLDRADVYNLYDQELAFTDPRNASAISAVIPGFICPSTPRNSNAASMNMTSIAISHVANSDPQEVSGNFIPYGLPARATGGAADYVISSGAKASLMKLLFAPDSPIIAKLTVEHTVKDNWGFGRPGEWMALTNIGYRSGGTTTIRSITDGLSNTTMIFELAGRNAVYHAEFRNLANGPSQAPLFDQLEIENQLAFGGGMWADPANGDYFIAGRVNSDGSGHHCGTNLINKSNMRSSAAGGGSYYYGYGCGPYGFHRGGAHALMCDGSVRLFSECMDGVTLCAVVGAQDGLSVGNF
jgi:prepilin-type processing-associated H-X9-DG protein